MLLGALIGKLQKDGLRNGGTIYSDSDGYQGRDDIYHRILGGAFTFFSLVCRGAL